MIRRKDFYDVSENNRLDSVQIPFWLLNDQLEREELTRQLALMRGQGIKNTIAHARSGYIGKYLGSDFFDSIDVIVSEKNKHQEKLWLYDEFDWPSGTCNGELTKKEEYREHFLNFETHFLQAGEVYQIHLSSVDLLCVCSFSSDGRSENLLKEKYIQYDGTYAYALKYMALEPVEIVVVTLCVDPYALCGRRSINYLDAECTRAFINAVYEKYYYRYSEEFGKTITAVFNDESRFCNPYPWCMDFPEEFFKRKGYNILTELAYLVRDDKKSARIRMDYFQVVSELFQQNYWKVLYDWCEEHQVQLCAHLLGEETLASQVRYSGDLLCQFRYIHVPCVDHLAKGIGSQNIKFVSSAARSYGRKLLACEAFGGSGNELTMQEQRRMLCWMVHQGVNLLINHAYYYSLREERAQDWPPSQFFQWEYWEKTSQLNAMLRRLYLCIANGKRICDVIIVMPTESFWADYVGDQRYKNGYYDCGPRIAGNWAKELDKQLQFLMAQLQMKNVDFQILHRDALENFEVIDGTIRNKLTGEYAPACICPNGWCVNDKMQKFLNKFENQGGLLIKQTDINDTVLTEIRKRTPLPFQTDDGCLQASISNPYYGDVIHDPYLHNGEDVRGVLFMRIEKEGDLWIYFVNFDNTNRELQLSTEYCLECWDPWTGEITECVRDEKGQTAVCLPAGYGTLVRYISEK
ncbi:glycosyl hydrolase [Roseburia hominis]